MIVFFPQGHVAILRLMNFEERRIVIPHDNKVFNLCRPEVDKIHDSSRYLYKCPGKCTSFYRKDRKD